MQLESNQSEDLVRHGKLLLQTEGHVICPQAICKVENWLPQVAFWPFLHYN